MDSPFSDVRRWFSHLLHNDPFLTAMSLSTCTEKVSIQAQQGQLVAVTGPHGSGKATLLRLLGHVVFPSGGIHLYPIASSGALADGRLRPIFVSLYCEPKKSILLPEMTWLKDVKNIAMIGFVLGFITLVVAWEWFWWLRCCMWRRKLWCWIPAHGKTCCSDVPIRVWWTRIACAWSWRWWRWRQRSVWLKKTFSDMRKVLRVKRAPRIAIHTKNLGSKT